RPEPRPPLFRSAQRVHAAAHRLIDDRNAAPDGGGADRPATDLARRRQAEQPPSVKYPVYPRPMNERMLLGRIVASYRLTSGGSAHISTATRATSSPAMM